MDTYVSPLSQANDQTERIFALLDAAVDGIVIIDGEGRIEQFNKAAVEMFGMQAEDVIGKNVSILMPEPDRSQHDGYLENYLNGEPARVIGIGRQVNARRADGSVFPAELSVGESAHGGGRCFVGFIRDISRRVAAEERLREQEERLTHVTRLSILGEMTAGIAHEVNQPLTAISTYAQAMGRLMDSGKSDNDEVRDTLKRISEQAQRAGEVIRHLSSLARKGHIQREVIDIGATIEDALELAKVDARSFGIMIEYHSLDKPLSAVADPVQIQQVILNLMRNGMESMDQAGVRNRPIIVSVTVDDDDFVATRVTDFGVGVDEKERGKLFEPFHTTKKSGMGIGLSISRSIINAHGGNLKYRPNDHGGATFEFTLPATI